MGTVHAFQGDQKDVIIFSTAISKQTKQKTYQWLKCNKELINVAVSRPKDKLIVLGNFQKAKDLSDGKDDLFELLEYVRTNGESKVTDVSAISSALGTRQISSESEQELKLTIEHALSVLNPNCYVKNEISVASIFEGTNVDSSLFYTGRFDLVIFERGFNRDILKLVIELNGPEHYTNEEVMIRDKKKKAICDEHKIDYLAVSRDCARDYILLKKAITTFVKNK